MLHPDFAQVMVNDHVEHLRAEAAADGRARKAQRRQRWFARRAHRA